MCRQGVTTEELVIGMRKPLQGRGRTQNEINSMERRKRSGHHFSDSSCKGESYAKNTACCCRERSLKILGGFHIAVSQPKLTNKPTVDSINTVLKWFFAGFAHMPGQIEIIERGMRYSVSQYCLRVCAVFDTIRGFRGSLGFWWGQRRYRTLTRDPVYTKDQGRHIFVPGHHEVRSSSSFVRSTGLPDWVTASSRD